MNKIKLSTLVNKAVRIVGSRKSKGQFSFVQKIKYFYLMTKYNTFRIERLTDMEINELISLINIKEFGYNKAIDGLKSDKVSIDNNVDYYTEQIGSVSPDQYLKQDMGNKLKAITDKADEMKKAADEKISENQAKIEEVEEFKEELKDELEARKIDAEVEEAVMTEANVEPKSTPLTDEDLNKIEAQILADLPTNEVKDEKIVEEPKKEVKIEDPTKEEPTTTVESTKIESGATAYDTIMAEANNKMNELQNEALDNIKNDIMNYFKSTAEVMNQMAQKIQAEDFRIAQEALDKKDAEIKAEQNKNADLTKTNEGLTSDLNKANATIEERDKTITDLNATVDQKNNEITEEQDKNAKLEQANKNLEAEKEELIKDNDSKDAKIKELEEALKARNDELAARDKVINEKDKEIEGLNSEVTKVQKEKQAIQDASSKQIENLRAILFPANEQTTGEAAKTM